MASLSPTEPLWPQLTLVAAVAASHMSMPNHWLPYSLVARAHSWTLRKALFLTFLGALGHVTNTILISLLISEIGGALISHHHYRLLSTSILFLGGLYYLYTYFVQRNRESCCSSHTLRNASQTHGSISKNIHPGADSATVHRAAAVSVVLLTALSPCVGSMPVLVSLMAPPVQPSTVLAAGAVLLATSVFVMCSLVGISYLGAATLDFEKIRRHERLVLGLGLVILAGLTFFVLSEEHEHDAHGHHAHGINEHVHAEHRQRNVFTEGLHTESGDGGRKDSDREYNDDANHGGHDKTWKGL